MNELPDTGERTEFGTGAVRDASVGKGHHSSIPPESINRLAMHFENGARKYMRNNWMKGIPLSRYQEAIMRHCMDAAQGKKDEDHLAAVMWNAACWMWTQREIEEGKKPLDLFDLPYYVNAPTPSSVSLRSEGPQAK